MKLKTIKKFITKKFNDWLDSIDDLEVKKLVKSNALISGGCITSMLQREPVNDYDVYFTTKEVCLSVAKYYARKMNEQHEDISVNVIDTDAYPEMEYTEQTYYKQRGFTQPGRVGIFCKSQPFEETPEEDIIDRMEEEKEKEDDGPKYRIKYISPNAISLSDHVQLVLRFYGDIETIHENFDFVHCTNYWSSKDEAIHLNQKALVSILTKELNYIGSKYPIASMIRVRKFVQRGWSCNAGVHLKIAFQISKLNMEDVSTLEDQLVGVDVAYFVMFIDAMKKGEKAATDEGKPFVITYGYVCEIIDRIFND